MMTTTTTTTSKLTDRMPPNTTDTSDVTWDFTGDLWGASQDPDADEVSAASSHEARSGCMLAPCAVCPAPRC